MIEKEFSEEFIREIEFCELICWRDIYAALDPALAKRCGIESFPFGGGLGVLASRIDILMFNRVFGLGLGDLPDELMIDQIKRRYIHSGVKRFFVQFDPLAVRGGLAGILLSRGFRHHNNWIRLYREIDRPLPKSQTDLKIKQIGIEHAMDFAKLVLTEFHMPNDLSPWFAKLAGRPKWRIYMAFDGQIPAAAAALFIDNAQAWIGFAATREKYRGRGAQGALVARRIQDAAALGCRRLVVETAENTPERNAPSFRNMLRFGFEYAYKKANFIYPGA